MEQRRRNRLSKLMKKRWEYARKIADKYLFIGEFTNVMTYLLPVIKDEGLKILAEGRNNRVKRDLVNQCSEIMTRLHFQGGTNNKALGIENGIDCSSRKRIVDEPIEQIKIAIWFIKKVGGIEEANKAFIIARQAMEAAI